MGNLEQIIQIISILVFLGGGITFFFKTGGYKTTVDTQLIELRKDTEENKADIKEIKNEISNMKTETNKVITNLNSNLSEIKARLDLLVQYSGILNGNIKNKE